MKILLRISAVYGAFLVWTAGRLFRQLYRGRDWRVALRRSRTRIGADQIQRRCMGTRIRWWPSRIDRHGTGREKPYRVCV